jgi:propanediol utilization protein
MGLVLVDRGGAENLTVEAPVAEAATVEEEPEIEEIVRPEEEVMAPQCVRVARKRGDEWVFYEEDHSDQAIQKL